ncbi:MAG: hypothetical protein JOZ72_02585 [Alphaproteobacteria bacterium]|nr:hypothetical protein [Alphaproteobacteria bacterium]
MAKKPATVRHLRWLIERRGENNVVGLKLLTLFENYGELINKRPHAVRAQMLVGVAFSLWRAAFLSETQGNIEGKVKDAENFLRKMLADNTIGFSHDMELREWSASYYIQNARNSLSDLGRSWSDDRLRSVQPKGRKSSKSWWQAAHEAFVIAVTRLESELEEAAEK